MKDTFRLKFILFIALMSFVWAVCSPIWRHFSSLINFYSPLNSIGSFILFCAVVALSVFVWKGKVWAIYIFLVIALVEGVLGLYAGYYVNWNLNYITNQAAQDRNMGVGNSIALALYSVYWVRSRLICRVASK